MTAGADSLISAGLWTVTATPVSRSLRPTLGLKEEGGLLRLNATAVKDFYQYGCDRQVRYLMANPLALEGLILRAPPAPAGPWAEAATAFERNVIDHLAATTGPVLRPPLGETYLGQAESAAFSAFASPRYDWLTN